MPYGLEVYDSIGNKVVDTSSRVSKYLGYFDILATTPDSSFQISNIPSKGIPYFFCTLLEGYKYTEQSDVINSPKVSLDTSQNTISWYWSSSQFKLPVRVSYGYY